MGTWTLEVFKMAIYMAFPVATFYYFHQPQYFEKWLIQMKKETYPPEDPNVRKALRDLAREFQERRETKMLEAMEKSMREK